MLGCFQGIHDITDGAIYNKYKTHVNDTMIYGLQEQIYSKIFMVTYGSKLSTFITCCMQMNGRYAQVKPFVCKCAFW